MIIIFVVVYYMTMFQLITYCIYNGGLPKIVLPSDIIALLASVHSIIFTKVKKLPKDTFLRRYPCLSVTHGSNYMACHNNLIVNVFVA